MWGSFDELYEEAFSRNESNFMTESNPKFLYFRLIGRYKSLSSDYYTLNKDYKHLHYEYTKLLNKYNALVNTSDTVSGYLYRKLLSSYNELKNDFDSLFQANVALSDELTRLKSADNEDDSEDEFHNSI